MIQYFDQVKVYEYSQECSTDELMNSENIHKISSIHIDILYFPTEIDYLYNLKIKGNYSLPNVILHSYSLEFSNYQQVAFLADKLESFTITNESVGVYESVEFKYICTIRFNELHRFIDLSNITINQTVRELSIVGGNSKGDNMNANFDNISIQDRWCDSNMDFFLPIH
jgi:hypothetical protein